MSVRLLAQEYFDSLMLPVRTTGRSSQEDEDEAVDSDQDDDTADRTDVTYAEYWASLPGETRNIQMGKTYTI